jgi:tetratricopeptide (TPR) repeat protein
MAAMMPLIAVSKRGVSSEDAAAQLAKVRAVAARFPGDAGVLAALAEAEHDAGNEKEAIDAADRAIRIDPTVKNAYVQKGYALFALAPDAPDPDKAYKAAMVPFAALNHLENDHPLPLIYFYRSFVQRGEEPPEAARAALERAALLAPFDLDLAMQAGMMVAREGKVALAIEFIKPVAFDPHGGKRAERAQATIAALKGMPEGEPVDTGKLAAMIEVAGSVPTIDVPDDEPDDPKKKKRP